MEQTKLDKFLIDENKNKVSFELQGKTIEAKINALTMMKLISALNKQADKQDEAQAAVIMLETVFGKEVAKEMFEKLNASGIAIIVEKIMEVMELDKNPSE